MYKIESEGIKEIAKEWEAKKKRMARKLRKIERMKITNENKKKNEGMKRITIESQEKIRKKKWKE